MRDDWDGEDRRTPAHWALDKRVPIALILAMTVQVVAWVWLVAEFKASTEARLSVLETWVAKNETITERLSVIETGQQYIRDDLQEIKTQLRKE